MDHIRATLDSLMGINRNGDKKYLEIKHFTDDRICKYNLMGYCPFNSRLRLSNCPFEQCPVAPKFVSDYEKEKASGKTFRFEMDTFKFYKRLIDDIEIEKKKNEERLEIQNKSSVRDQDNEEITALEKEMHKITGEIEASGAEGNVEQALELTEKLEALKTEKDAIKARTNKAGNHQELIVCDVCARILSVNETDQRLADHFSGTTHQGYQIIRNLLKKLEVDMKNDRPPHHFHEQRRPREHYHHRNHHDRRPFKRRRY